MRRYLFISAFAVFLTFGNQAAFGDAPRWGECIRNGGRWPLAYEKVRQCGALARQIEREGGGDDGGESRASEKSPVDLEALRFAYRVWQNPRNVRLQASYERLLNDPAPSAARVEVWFVPGWLYLSHPETGADLDRQRQWIGESGAKTRLMDLPEDGSVVENASLLARAVRSVERCERPIVLVSASKGGAEVAWALGGILEPAESRCVVAWVNVGGLLGGTPLAEDARKWPMSWAVSAFFAFKGRRTAAIFDMTRAESRRRIERLHLPDHVTVINYLGVPFSFSVSDLARGGYEDLRKMGPNDGLMLLEDAVLPQTQTILEVGLDHFFVTPDLRKRTLALLKLVLSQLDGDGAGSEREPPSSNQNRP